MTEKNKENKYSDVLTNSAEFGVIDQRDFFDKDIASKKNLNGYYVVENNDFIYNPRISNFAPVGPVKRNRLNKTGVMSPLYYVFRMHNIDLNFIESYFKGNKWHYFMLMNGDTGARSDRFAIKDTTFTQMLIPSPSAQEQQKVGQLFEKLDRLIAVNQRAPDPPPQMKILRCLHRKINS